MEYVDIVANCCEALNEMFDRYYDAGINIIAGGANGTVGLAQAVVVYDKEHPNSCCIGILPIDNE